MYNTSNVFIERARMSDIRNEKIIFNWVNMNSRSTLYFLRSLTHRLLARNTVSNETRFVPLQFHHVLST